MPERSLPCLADTTSPLRFPLGASPRSSSGSSICATDFWCAVGSRGTVVSLSFLFGPSSDDAGSKRMGALRLLLRPLLTSHAATSRHVPSSFQLSLIHI